MKKFTKMIAVDYVDCDGVVFNINSTVDLLYELEDTDGYFTFILINDNNQRGYLEKKGIASTNARGSSYVKKSY